VYRCVVRVGWGIGGSVIAADCGSKVRSFGQWAAANCTAPPSVISGQYATSNCKPLLVTECKWRYINVETFNLLILYNAYNVPLSFPKSLVLTFSV